MKKLHGCMVIAMFAFVVAFMFTGCEAFRGLFGMGEEEPDPPTPDPVGYSPDLYGPLWYVNNVDGGGSDTNLGTTPEAPFATVGKALTAIQAEYNAIDPDWTEKSAGIVILDNVAGVQTGTDGGDPYILLSGTYPPIVLMGKAPGATGEAKELTWNLAGGLFSVKTGVHLTLWNITLRGSDNSDGRYLIRVDGGTVVLETGAVIRDHYSEDMGGGVAVRHNSSTLIMRAGSTIMNNQGSYGAGGVLVFGNSEFEDGVGTFEMVGGTISGNRVLTSPGGHGGGVYIGNGGVFIKSGGIIYGANASEENANHACGYGKGDAVWLATNPTKKRTNTLDEHTPLSTEGGIAGYANWDEEDEEDEGVE